MADMEMDVEVPHDQSRTFRPPTSPKRSGLRTFFLCVLCAFVSALVLVAIR